jgi:hypothetical protein
VSNDTELQRMDVAQDGFDDALKALKDELRELQLDIHTRIPDQDDWDDTLNATASLLRDTRTLAIRCRNTYKAGS